MRNPRLEDAIQDATETVKLAVELGVFQPANLKRRHAIRRSRCPAWCVSSLPDGILPNDVRAFVYDELAKDKTLLRGRGKHVSGEFRRRDAFLVALLEHMHNKFGFNPTRNDASRDNHSASSIVHIVLNRLGLKLAERTIDDIWTSRSNSGEKPV